MYWYQIYWRNRLYSISVGYTFYIRTYVWQFLESSTIQNSHNFASCSQVQCLYYLLGKFIGWILKRSPQIKQNKYLLSFFLWRIGNSFLCCFPLSRKASWVRKLRWEKMFVLFVLFPHSRLSIFLCFGIRYKIKRRISLCLSIRIFTTVKL